MIPTKTYTVCIQMFMVNSLILWSLLWATRYIENHPWINKNLGNDLIWFIDSQKHALLGMSKLDTTTCFFCWRRQYFGSVVVVALIEIKGHWHLCQLRSEGHVAFPIVLMTFGCLFFVFWRQSIYIPTSRTEMTLVVIGKGPCFGGLTVNL